MGNPECIHWYLEREGPPVWRRSLVVSQKRWYHGYRAARSHPSGHDVQLLDRPGRSFDVEMDNSSSELIDYFLKRRDVRRT